MVILFRIFLCNIAILGSLFSEQMLCSISLISNDVEILAPAFIEINLKSDKTTPEKKNFSIFVEDEVGNLKEHKWGLPLRIGWSHLGEFKKELMVFYSFSSKELFFKSPGHYTVFLKFSDGSESNKEKLRVINSSFDNISLGVNSELRKGITSKEYLQLLYLKKTDSPVGLEVANFINSKFQESELSKFTRVCSAIYGFDEFMRKVKNKGVPHDYIQCADELHTAISNYSSRNETLRGAEYRKAYALALSGDVKKSTSELTHLLEKGDHISERASQLIEEINTIK